MLHRTIFVVGAGLAWYNGEGSKVIVDADAARLCKTAAKAAEEFPDAQIYITAGRSERFKTTIHDVYAECLIALGVPEARIRPAMTGGWGTNAEVAALPTLRSMHVHKVRDAHEIIVVNRDFHLRRTTMLLRAHLHPWELKQTIITERPSFSRERRKNFFREPIVLIRDWVLHVLPLAVSHRFGGDCPRCKGRKTVVLFWETNSPGMHRSELCVRCGWTI